MENEKLLEILAEHKKWLESSGKEGSRADLRWADLSRADLRGADLRWADLSRADLRGADLSRADLRWADLSRADLSRADLSRADLRGADLSGADLSRANLRGANLRGADLSGANLDYACWPLWCGSLTTKVDERIARQLLYHAFAVGTKFFPDVLTEDQKTWLQKFEHATDTVNSKM